MTGATQVPSRRRRAREQRRCIDDPRRTVLYLTEDFPTRVHDLRAWPPRHPISALKKVLKSPLSAALCAFGGATIERPWSRAPDRVSEEGIFPQLKRLVVGKPIPSHLAHHERLSRTTGLAVLSSDALSSVAYATEEILRVLILVGAGALGYASPIAFVIAAILAIVVFSYRQTIHAYPSGGGAYLVSKDNLGEMPALIAAGALLIDYVLTVAVSIAAGVAAITSAFPQWHVNRVEMTLGFVVLLMLGNLRGIRESGNIFAIPTYFFIVTTLGLIGVGIWRVVSGDVQPVVTPDPVRSEGA